MKSFETYRAADVHEAIEPARTLRLEKGYDLFRGQLRAEWPPYTSLTRLQLREPTSLQIAQEALHRSWQWLRQTPGLQEIREDVDATFAVAQHYGIPTHYLDFTTDPSIAGFFASDSDVVPSGIDSRIFCVNSAHLMHVWTAVREVRIESGGQFPELEIVRPTVPNLWRMQAQRGVFLYAPTNWDHIYAMDRSVFPFTGYPSEPTEQDVYPARKSQLEILLDQYFDNERKLAAAPLFRKSFEEARRVDPEHTAWVETSRPPQGYLPE
jgi:hypothetical protein